MDLGCGGLQSIGLCAGDAGDPGHPADEQRERGDGAAARAGRRQAIRHVQSQSRRAVASRLRLPVGPDVARLALGEQDAPAPVRSRLLCLRAAGLGGRQGARATHTHTRGGVA